MTEVEVVIEAGSETMMVAVVAQGVTAVPGAAVQVPIGVTVSQPSVKSVG